MSGGAPLGSAEVEVRANIDKLLRGFQQAKGQTRAFENDMRGITRQTELTAAAENRLHNELRQLARAYDPVHAAMLRYQEDLIRIRRLQAAGIVDRTGAARLMAGAKAEMDSVTNAGQAMGGMALFLRGALGGLAGIVGFQLVGAMAQATMGAIKATAAIKDQAAAVGLGTDAFQEYQLIAKEFGLSQDEINTAFREFDQTVRQAAAGAERPERLFKMLGVSLKDAGGAMKSNEQLFTETIDKLGQVGNHAERAAGAALAFGETAGPKMGQLISAGTEKIDELREAVRQTGMVMSSEEIEKADETAKKLEQVKQVLSAKFAHIVVENADSIGQLIDVVGDLIGAALDAPRAISGMVDWIGRLGPTALDQIPVLGQLLQMIRLIASTKSTVATELGEVGSSARVKLNRGGSADAEARRRGLKLKSDEDAKGGGGISLAGLLDRQTKPRGGGGGKKAAVENRFDEELLREQERRLQLLKASSGSLAQINEIERQLIDINLQQRNQQIDDQLKRKALSAAEARALKLKAAENAQLEREAADRQMREDLIERTSRAHQESLRLEEESLSVDLRLARTDEQRERVEAALLALKQEQQRLEIDKSIALAREAGDQDRIAELVEQRRQLLENQKKEMAAFDVENLRGIEKLRNDLPRTVDEINEQIERIRFDLLVERLQRAAEMSEEVGDAFGQFAGEIAQLKSPWDALRNLVSSLARTMTENVIERPVSEWATKAIGLPLAKQTYGRDVLGPDKLTVDQMNMALNIATQNLGALQIAAQQAAFALSSAGASAGGAATANQAAAVATDQLAPAASTLTGEFQQQVPVLGQFGGGLMSILNSLAGAGGGGGGGGFLGSLLNIGMALAGPAGFGGGGLGSGLGSAFGAAGGAGVNFIPGLPNGGIQMGFSSGGYTGDGNPKDIAGVVHKREWVWDADTTKQFMPVLRDMSAGRLPDLAIRKAGRPEDPAGGGSARNLALSFGALHFHGAQDDRSMRRSARQFEAHLQRRLGEVVRTGINK